MEIYQPINGYRYNSDSIFLYQFIRMLNPKGKVLDVGCGVGILSALLTRDFDVQTTAVDIQANMLKYAEYNYGHNGLDVKTKLCDISELGNEDRFDYVISNPPFYDSNVNQSKNSTINIARYTHNMPLDTLVKSIKRLLVNRGYFVLCYDAKQADVLLSELGKSGIKPEIIRFLHPKIDRDAKIVMVAARVGSKSMLKVMPPLVVFDENDNYLPEAKKAIMDADSMAINVETVPSEKG